MVHTAHSSRSAYLWDFMIGGGQDMGKTVWMEPGELENVRLQGKIRRIRALIHLSRQEAFAFLFRNGSSDCGLRAQPADQALQGHLQRFGEPYESA